MPKVWNNNQRGIKALFIKRSITNIRFSKSHFMSKHMLWMIIGYLIFGLMFCIIYSKGVEAGSATQQGLRYGIMVGFLTAVSLGFILHGVSAMGGMEEWSELSTVLRDSAFEVVKLGILGVIIAHLSGLHASVDSRGDTSGGRSQPQPPPPESPGGN